MKTNIQLISLIKELKKASIENDASIWKRIAKELEKPTKRRRAVNISKIDKVSEDNETVIVPGKVLAMGKLSKKLTIAAYRFSKSAQKKIQEQGSKTLSIKELIEQNPKGSKIKIVG